MGLLEARINLTELPAFAGTFLVFLLTVAGVRKLILSLPERGGYRGQLAIFVIVLSLIHI